MKKFSLKNKKTAIICVVIGVVLLVGCSDYSEHIKSETDNVLMKEYSDKAFGHAFRKEYKEAADYFLKAAELGHILSQRKIAEWYYNGTGVPKDLQKSLVWYKKAAEQGDANSRFVLGCWYETGNVVEKNLDEAAIWFYKSITSTPTDESIDIRKRARKGYDNMIKMGATPPTDIIDEYKKVEASQSQFLKKSAALVKKEFGFAGLIAILISSIFVYILFGRIESSFSQSRINIWVAPIAFAVSAVILWFTEGFYAPGIEGFVLNVLIIAFIYQSYKIVKTSKSFLIILLRIAITFFVSMFCFYAAAVATLLVPIIIVILFIKSLLTPQTSRSSSSYSTSSNEREESNVAADCRSCSRYPGHAKYCDLGHRNVSDFHPTQACNFYRF